MYEIHLNKDEKYEERIEFYNKYSQKYSRSDVPRKLPLEFLSGDKFRESIGKYMQTAFRKGVPPLFKGIKYLLKDETKLKIVEELVLSYAENLQNHGFFTCFTRTEKEAPTCYLWVLYFLAQLYDYLNDYEKAFEYINKAIEHTPTLVELYIVKGRISKHAGNYYEAVKWMDEAQSLDTADRFINYKCTKYMLRANMIKEAEEIASKFTRVFKIYKKFIKLYFSNCTANQNL